jgi:prepilin-type N-terminal cleavage/methylation domain-containing protein
VRSHQQKQLGFTLRELSIVLVVIGLIIGGVLVGQDLVKAAATRATLAQIEKYNTAANTFRNKYNGIPGDLDLADATNFGFTISDCLGDGSTPAGGRNGNGLIEGAGISEPLAAYMGENELFWLDLSAAHLIDSNISDSRSTLCNSSLTALSATIIGQYVPTAKLGGGNFIQVYGLGSNNWFMLSGMSLFYSLTSYANGVPTLSVSQAYNMDKKVDDGLPTTGKVVAVYVTTSQTVTTLAPNDSTSGGDTTTCYDTTTNQYSTGISGGALTNCALSFQMQGAAR